MDPENDPFPSALERRCPRLGGPVSFSYCLCSETDRRPCFKMLDCWWERFDVVGYLTRILGSAEVEKLQTAAPRPKVQSLLDLVAAAKARLGHTPEEPK
jgi:hypothetical protein